MEHLRTTLNEVRAWIDARDTGTPVERLRILSLFDDIEVRRRVAINSFTPVDVLRRLAIDSNGSVRANVGLNPATPRDLLYEIASDTSLDTILSTADLFALHEDVLQVLASHSNPFVQRQARRELAGLKLERLLQSRSITPVLRSKHPLGRILMASGLLTKGELDRFLPAAAAWKLPLGQVLVRASGISPETVCQALYWQSKMEEGGRSLKDVVEILELRRSMGRDGTYGDT